MGYRWKGSVILIASVPEVRRFRAGKGQMSLTPYTTRDTVVAALTAVLASIATRGTADAIRIRLAAWTDLFGGLFRGPVVIGAETSALASHVLRRAWAAGGLDPVTGESYKTERSVVVDPAMVAVLATNSPRRMSRQDRLMSARANILRKIPAVLASGLVTDQNGQPITTGHVAATVHGDGLVVTTYHLV